MSRTVDEARMAVYDAAIDVRAQFDRSLDALIEAVRAEMLEVVRGLQDGTGMIARDKSGHAYDPAIVMRNAVIDALEQKP